jgi:hypothetical protein
MNSIFTLQHTLDLWIAGLVTTAFVIQGALQPWFASSTSWAFTGGWQREIAVFDLCLALILWGARGSDAIIEAVVLAPFLLMFALLGTNHFVALVRAPNKPGHWAGVAANVIAIGFGSIAVAVH